MIEDPIIAEIRHYRKKHAAQYDYDLKRMVAALKIEEMNSQRLFLNPGPKIMVKKHTPFELTKN